MRIFWVIITITFSFLLYCTFGVLCAVGYKALQGDFYEASLESSPSLYNFLEDKDAKQAVFSEEEIQNGIVNIMFCEASKNTKKGEAVVLSAIPVVIFGETPMVAVPIILNSIFGRLECNILFEYKCVGKIELQNVSVGRAKFPKFLGRFIADIVEAHYKDCFGNVFSQIDSLQINFRDGKAVLRKE